MANHYATAVQRLLDCPHPPDRLGSSGGQAWCSECGAVRMQVATYQGSPWLLPAALSSLRAVAKRRPA